MKVLFVYYKNHLFEIKSFIIILYLYDNYIYNEQIDFLSSYMQFFRKSSLILPIH